MSEPHERRQVHAPADVEVRVNSAVLEALASHKNLSGTELRIMMLALRRMDARTGIAHLTRDDLARHFTKSLEFVSRATTKLSKLGLLWRVDSTQIQVNPHFAFRGETREDWEQVIRDLPRDAPAIRIPTTPTSADLAEGPTIEAEKAPRPKKKPHLHLVK